MKYVKNANTKDKMVQFNFQKIHGNNLQIVNFVNNLQIVNYILTAQ